MNFPKILLTVLVLMYFHCPRGYAQSKLVVDKVLHEYLTTQQQRMRFSGVVMVSIDNHIIYQDVVGLASRELSVPVTPKSVFRIASITKQFTALLTLLAEEEDRLTLADSLGHFFPELTDSNWQKITLHQLLTHTSGLPHNEGIANYWNIKSFLPLSDKQAIAEIFDLKLLADPGKETHYSSPGYFLLASVLEKVYQDTYANIVARKMTVPLGLANTGVASSRKIIPQLTSAYHMLGDSMMVAPNRDFSLMKGSGDLYASAEDLTRWNSRLLADTMWTEEIKKKLFSVHNQQPVHGNEDAYGYGWFIRSGDDRKRKAYYTGGGTFGCSAISVIYPKEKMSIVILSNVSALPVNELWHDIEKIVFGEDFELPVIHIERQLSSEHLGKMSGKYVAENGMALSISLSGNQLYAKLGNNPIFEIYPEQRFRFYGKKVEVALHFQSDEEGNITRVEAERKGQKVTFSKQ
ncbi:serine hydrolase domain-containing protein [Persicitalea sp.]|uniref:serine hydrolase domain-containing protein n=1 Tax=Persicitalea sp. TaxID=3100273 RepID=UPI003594816D